MDIGIFVGDLRLVEEHVYLGRGFVPENPGGHPSGK